MTDSKPTTLADLYEHISAHLPMVMSMGAAMNALDAHAVSQKLSKLDDTLKIFFDGPIIEGNDQLENKKITRPLVVGLCKEIYDELEPVVEKAVEKAKIPHGPAAKSRWDVQFTDLRNKLGDFLQQEKENNASHHRGRNR